MDQNIALIVAVIVLAAIVVAGVLYVVQRRRSRDMHTRFGPEYERAMATHGDRRAAEHALADRERRAGKLSLRQLEEGERLSFLRAWDSIQRRFVDDPVEAAAEAHRLLEQVMERRGYPTQSFEEEVDLLSVHYPNAVQHYRAAHTLADEQGEGDRGTEQIRQAMIHYRVLFHELLEADEVEGRDTLPNVAAPPPRPESRA